MKVIGNPEQLTVQTVEGQLGGPYMGVFRNGWLILAYTQSAVDDGAERASRLNLEREPDDSLFACPVCKHEMISNAVGKTVECPKCSAEVIVPKPI